MKQQIDQRNAQYVPAFTLAPDQRAVEVHAPPAVQAPNFINDVAAGKVELPTIPQIVQSLLAALRDPNVDARRIGNALAQDPVLSARCCAWRTPRFSAGSARWRRSTPPSR